MSEQRAVKSVEVQSFGLNAGPQSFWYLFIALSITRSKLTQKFVVRVCHVATVVMATTQLVLSKFKNFLSHQFGELNEVYRYQK